MLIHRLVYEGKIVADVFWLCRIISVASNAHQCKTNSVAQTRGLTAGMKIGNEQS